MMTVQKRDKTPELTKAKYAVWDYFKKNKLDPGKDYTKDPVHGEIVTRLLIKLNKERDKEILRYPARDLPYQLIFTRKMKKNKEAKEAKKAAKAAEEKATKKAKVEKVDKKEKKAPAKKSTKYDYPLVDGREMTAEEKKKFRMAERKKANKAEKPVKEEKKAKKAEKAPKEAEAPKKKDKKKKKEED